MEMDVIKHGRWFAAVLLLLVAVSLDAQVSNDKLKKHITITGAGIRVDSFLNHVSRQTGLGFSFNSKKISPTKYITIKKGSYTMAQCLAEIQKVTGIHYAVKNDHIILVDNPPQEKYRLNLGVVKKPVAKRTVVNNKAVVIKKPVVRNTLPVSRDTVIPVVLKKDSISTTDSIPVKDSLPGIIASSGRHGLPGLFPGQTDTTVTRLDSLKKAKARAIAKKPDVTSKPDRSTYKPGRSRPASSVYNQAYDASASSFHIGIVALRPDIYDMIGLGLNLLYEQPFANDNWSVTASAGYHMVLGDYTITQFKYDTFVSPDTLTIDTTLKNFSQIPVLIGIRWYAMRPFYAGFEAGYSIKASNDVSSSVSLAPSLGLKFPVGGKAIDINVKYLYMLPSPTIPEKPRLQKGDYGLWSLRIAYAF